MKSIIYKMLCLLLLCSPAWGLIKVVAAETCYADVAQTLGGKFVEASPLMANINQDPHLFTASVAQAKALSQADIVVFNGAGYDTWVENLLPALKRKNQLIVEVAALLSPAVVTNPHIWYDPVTMPLYAKALTARFKQLDSAHATYFDQRLQQFLKAYQHLEGYLATLKQRDAGKTILVTEPLFEPMAKVIGLHVIGEGFARSMMNEASPSPQDIAEFEEAITQRRAQALIYNVQQTSPLLERMKDKARDHHIPVVGIRETQPLDKHYIDWMREQLRAVDGALNGSH
ncbi:MAG: zinc ABC transporter substrate-binding protein [Gammaproteobacteria bacterium]|nr:zinc ABC transporter substrate-binding protein [Gammaproteobacteria bacterium]